VRHLQEPSPGIFGGALNSIDVVRHLQSSDSYTVDVDSCSDYIKDYFDLIEGIKAEPLPEFTSVDVICGQGKGHHHPGNQYYLGLIEARAHEYKVANSKSLKTKTDLAQEVIDSVHEKGGRFFQKEERGNEIFYTEVPITDKDLLLDKVKSAFRGRLKILKGKGGS